MTLTIDDSGFPLVVVRAASPVTADEQRRYDAAIDALFARCERLAVLFEADNDTMLDADQRRWAARVEERHAEDLRRLVVCQAVVTPSAVTRGLVAALGWLAPPLVQRRTFADVEPARAWVTERLRAAGLL